MAFKFRIGNFVIINTAKSGDDWEQDLDKKLDSVEVIIESRIRNWVLNDRFFDGLRNTPGRILITLMSWTGLFGLGFVAFTNGSLAWWYAATMAILVILNQLSVRFVFSDEENRLVDEYQSRRRDKAYHGAYRRVASMVTLILILVLGNWAFDFGGERFISFTASLPFVFQVNWSLEQLFVVLIAIFSYFSLLKYLAWGMKGEPMRPSAQPND